MEVIVYIDVIFTVNFMADLLILLMTGIFLRQKIKLWRVFLGALFGAGSLLPFLRVPHLLMGGTGIAVCVGISMGTIAISFGGRNGGFVKKWFLSTTVMFLLGGVMYYLKVNMGWTVLSLYKWGILLVMGFAACLMGGFLLERNRRQEQTIYPVKIIRSDKIVHAYMYLDTGNMLWDALYQKPVIILGEQTAKKCLSEKEQLVLEKIQEKQEFDYYSILNASMQRKNSFHRVRYKSMGMENGWLVCFLADEVWVDEKYCLKGQPVAVAPVFLFQNRKYQGLLHKACIYHET